MKLISMTDFVLKQSERIMNCELTHLESHHQIVDYAKFLKQPLKLEMFVPCVNGEPILEVPYYADRVDKVNEYKKAKEKVLFEGFEIYTNKEEEMFILGDYTCLKVSDLENGTIEDLVKYVYIKLTTNAIKRIFG